MSTAHILAARQHAKARAAERYGVYFSDRRINDHQCRIRRGDAIYLGAGSAGRKLYGIREAGRVSYPVFCTVLDVIVTYLGSPSEWRGSFAYAGAENGLRPHGHAADLPAVVSPAGCA